MKNPTSNKKGRHRNTPGKAKRIANGKVWEELKAKTLGRSTTFSAKRLALTITQFKKRPTL